MKSLTRRMPDLFSEVELGEQRPKDALGGGSSGSSVSLARASGDPLVDLHEGGRSNRGEGTGDAPAKCALVVGRCSPPSTLVFVAASTLQRRRRRPGPPLGGPARDDARVIFFSPERRRQGPPA